MSLPGLWNPPLTPHKNRSLSDGRIRRDAAADEIQRQKKMIVQHVFFHRDSTKAGALGHWAGKGISADGF